MSKMLVLIMVEDDGTSFRLSSNLELMKAKFQEAKDQELYSRITLAEVEENAEIGYDVYSEFYGGDVIMEWNIDNEEE